MIYKFHRIRNQFPKHQSYIYNIYILSRKNMHSIHIYIEENQCSVTEPFLSTHLGMVTIPPIKMLSHKNRIMGYIYFFFPKSVFLIVATTLNPPLIEAAYFSGSLPHSAYSALALSGGFGGSPRSSLPPVRWGNIWRSFLRF